MPLIYTNIAYALLFMFVFITWSASELLGPARWQGTRAVNKDRGSMRTLVFFGLAGTILYFTFPLLIPRTTITEGQSLFFFIGLGLVLFGSMLRLYSISTLGRYFTGTVRIADDQRVVQHGPYRYIRHPSYAGVLAIILGIGLMMTNWASCIAITAGLLTGLLYRISVEEKALQQLPGYVEYMQRTKRLIPFVF